METPGVEPKSGARAQDIYKQLVAFKHESALEEYLKTTKNLDVVMLKKIRIKLNKRILIPKERREELQRMIDAIVEK